MRMPVCARASPSMLVSTPAMMLQQGGLAGAVQAEHADLGAGKKDREMSRRMVRLGGTTFETRFMV